MSGHDTRWVIGPDCPYSNDAVVAAAADLGRIVGEHELVYDFQNDNRSYNRFSWQFPYVQDGFVGGSDIDAISREGCYTRAFTGKVKDFAVSRRISVQAERGLDAVGDDGRARVGRNSDLIGRLVCVESEKTITLRGIASSAHGTWKRGCNGRLQSTRRSTTLRCSLIGCEHGTRRRHPRP